MSKPHDRLLTRHGLFLPSLHTTTMATQHIPPCTCGDSFLSRRTGAESIWLRVHEAKEVLYKIDQPKSPQIMPIKVASLWMSLLEQGCIPLGAYHIPLLASHEGIEIIDPHSIPGI